MKFFIALAFLCMTTFVQGGTIAGGVGKPVQIVTKETMRRLENSLYENNHVPFEPRHERVWAVGELDINTHEGVKRAIIVETVNGEQKIVLSWK